MFFVSWPLYYIRYLIPISGKLCCVLTCYYRQKYKYDYPLFTNVGLYSILKNILLKISPLNWKVHIMILTSYLNSNISNITEVIDQNKRK